MKYKWVGFCNVPVSVENLDIVLDDYYIPIDYLLQWTKQVLLLSSYGNSLNCLVIVLCHVESLVKIFFWFFKRIAMTAGNNIFSYFTYTYMDCYNRAVPLRSRCYPAGSQGSLLSPLSSLTCRLHCWRSWFQEYSPRNSFSNLKQHYSAALGLGALLSSPTWRGAI